MEAEGSSISPRRFALQYSPPLLVLEYVDEPTRRLKHLRVHMEKALRSETPEIVSRLRRKFPTHLAHPAVKEEKLASLVDRLKAHAGRDTGSPSDAAAGSADAAALLSQDLNKVSEEENLAAKQYMDVNFERNRVKPGDKQFEYDVRKEFGEPAEECDWDEEDSDDD